jgi:5-methylcytosine-specific restriction endonuclease McrA
MSEAMSLEKRKAIRRKGRKLIELYQAVYERDQGRCVNCSRHVEPGTIPHHILFKSQGGGDEMDNLQTLCQICHGRAHGINIKGG